MMRKLCPNLDNQDGLETVLEVPIPEEMYTKMGSSASLRWQNMCSLMKAQRSANFDRLLSTQTQHLEAKSDNEFLALLKLVGAPLIPFQVHLENYNLSTPLSSKDSPLEASTAKYIVQQYIAATGGHLALSSATSMYAVGQVKMQGTGIHRVDVEDESMHNRGNCEVGGFVLWQKNPDLWYLELVVSGFKVSAGSDGKVAWNQSSSQSGNANRGPPRPLRRFFQGLDPRCTASLFLDAIYSGEQAINNEDCFILKVETSTKALQVQSSAQTEIILHTIWGYFSQRTGLLVKFDDKKLVRIIPSNEDDESVFWETSTESWVQNYKYIDDGISVAHSGKTITTLHRYGKSHNNKRKIEETWKIDEVDFNICGLSNETFLPPADLKREQEGGEQ